MNTNFIVGGIVLMIIAFFVTILTLGLGICCMWPIGLIGLILFIIGLVIEGDNKISNQPSRYCPNCGRPIPMDAVVCPYCGKDFRKM